MVEDQGTPHEHNPSVWTDKYWAEWSEYADQVRVEVRFKSWLDADDEPEFWVLESDGAEWSKDWLSRQLVELAAFDAERSCCGRGNYTLDVTDRKTEWGASGAAVEAILTLSQNLLSEATWVALGALGQKLATRLKEKHPDWSAPPMTQEQARESAKWAVLMRYRELTHETLDIRSVEFVDDRTVHVVLKETTSGLTYTVEIVGHSESVRRSRIRKIAQPDGTD